MTYFVKRHEIVDRIITPIDNQSLLFFPILNFRWVNVHEKITFHNKSFDQDLTLHGIQTELAGEPT